MLTDIKKLLLILTAVFVLALGVFAKNSYAQSYPWSLSVNPTYSCNSSTGQWTLRWNWSGLANTSVFLFIYRDSVSGPPADEPLVYQYQIPASQSASGSHNWVLPLANQQYVAMINAFGQASHGVAVVGTTSPCASPPPPPPPPQNPDLVARNTSDGTSPAANVSAPATISGNTISVPANTAFNISFRTRNNGPGATVANSRTVAENFGASTGTYNQFTVGPLAANASSTHSFSTSYATAGTRSILLRVDADGNAAETNEGNNDVFLTVNVTPPAGPPTIPTANPVGGLPTCVNVGTTYGTGLNFSWSASTGATSYTVRLTRPVNTGGDFSTKTVTTTSTNGTGGWSGGGNPLVTWVTAGGNLAMVAGETYFYTVKAVGPGGDSGYDLTGRSVQIGPVPECPPSNPSGLTASAVCDASGRAAVTFSFSDTSGNEDMFWLDVNGAAWSGATTPSPWAVETINRVGVERTGTGAVTFVWTDTSVLDTGDVSPALAGEQRSPGAGTYWWRVRANSTTAGGSAHVYPANSLTPPGTSITVPACAPSTPTFLQSAGACLAADAQVMFRFFDNSTNEDQFVLEVNDRPWNAAGTGPTPWGVKTFTRTAAQKTGVGSSITFVWRTTQTLDSGNANSAGGSPLIPLEGKTYHWRVRAVTSGGSSSANVYAGPLPDGIVTTTPPGVPAITPVCVVDLQVSIIDGSFRNSAGVVSSSRVFDAKEKITFSVKVDKAPGVNSSATDLYVYYKDMGNQMPNCGATPARVASGIPTDSAGAQQRYAIPALSDASPTTTINITMSIDSISATLHVFAVPACNFDDPDWSSNTKSATYIVDTKGFIETLGGDVGAVGNITMPVDSSVLVPPRYQGDYFITADDMNTAVDSKNSWILKDYKAKQLPGGGLYSYFETKFKGRADSTCSFSHSAQFRNCNGNLTFNTADVAPGGTVVFFVKQDLRFKKNFELDSNSAVLFLVEGDVVVDLGVNRIDGVYIVKGSFKDSDVVDSGVADVGGALAVNGAVFAEGNADPFVLERYFTSAINKTEPSNRFVWDAKYLVKLSELVGSASINWKEVAP